MLTFNWGNVFIQPWIFLISGILFIRTNELSVFPHCLCTWAVYGYRLNWNRLKSQCQHLLTIPTSSSTVTKFPSVLHSGGTSTFSLIPLYLSILTSSTAGYSSMSFNFYDVVSCLHASILHNFLQYATLYFCLTFSHAVRSAIFTPLVCY